MIDELYEAFARVPRPVAVEGCPCCVGPEEGPALLARPPRELGADELRRFAAKALNTWGEPEDVRYFAPRLLELAADDAFGYPDAEIVFGKLAGAGWRDWPEYEVVARFLRWFWTGTLARFPSVPSVNEAVRAIVSTGSDLAPCLREWENGVIRADGPAVRHLHDFTYVAYSGLRWRHGRPRWDGAWARDGREVIAWLVDGPVHRAVASAFDRTDDPELLELLAETDDFLRAFPP